MSSKVNLILDLSIFTVFLTVANPTITGETSHEWVALTFAVAIFMHVLFHWDWLVSIGKEYFKKIFHQSRLNYGIDVLFFIAMTVTCFSGLMISKSILSTLGIHLDVSRSWKTIHKLGSDTSLILLGIHFALHLKWIVNTVKCHIVNPVRGLLRNLFPRKPDGTASING